MGSGFVLQLEQGSSPLWGRQEGQDLLMGAHENLQAKTGMFGEQCASITL